MMSLFCYASLRSFLVGEPQLGGKTDLRVYGVGTLQRTKDKTPIGVP